MTSPDVLVNLIYDDLVEWAKSRHGVIGLTKSAYDLVEMMQMRPKGWRLTIHWEGDEPAGSTSIRDVRVVENRIRMIIDGDLGPSLVPFTGLIKPVSSNRTPFLSLMSAVRSRVMAYRFPWLNEPNNRLRYLRSDDSVPLSDGYHIAAYNLSFLVYSEIEHEAEIPLTLSKDQEDD